MAATEPIPEESTASNDSDTSVGTIKAADQGHDDSSLISLEEGDDETAKDTPHSNEGGSGLATSQGGEEGGEATHLDSSTNKQSGQAESSQTAAQESPARSSQPHEHQNPSSSSTQSRRRVRSSTVHTIDVQEETTRASRFTLWETRTVSSISRRSA